MAPQAVPACLGGGMTTTTTEPTSTSGYPLRGYPKDSWFEGDPFTMGVKLCDDDGVVRSDARYPSGYQCTGHAHRHGHHIECTSPAHTLPPTTIPMQHFSLVVQPSNDGYACLRIALDVLGLLEGVPEDDETRQLKRDALALQRVGRWLTTAKPILLPATLTASSISGKGFPAGGFAAFR